MQNEIIDKKYGIFSREYWFDASKMMKSTKMLVIAALIVALRVVVKPLKINIVPGLGISLDAYVNSLGSTIYGPVMGLVVGIFSDVLGLIVTGKMGEYFPPFTLVEMMSSFIFGIFLWKREITFKRVLASKFCVNLVCNIVMTSVFQLWMIYVFSGAEAASKYSIINGVRIAKNLVLFPIEATLIVIVLSAALPVVARMGVIERAYSVIKAPTKKRFILEVALFTLLSVAIVLIYYFWLGPLLSELNFKISIDSIFK